MLRRYACRMMVPSVFYLQYRTVFADHFHGPKLQEILKTFEQWNPKALAMDWDNTGLLIEPICQREHEIKKIFLTNDLTTESLDEAIKEHTDLIYAYHPPIFSKLKKMTQKSIKEKIVIDSIRNDIAVYCPHTSSDCTVGGVTDWLASFMQNLVPFSVQPIINQNMEHNLENPFSNNLDMGTGRLVTLEKELPFQVVYDQCKTFLKLDHGRVAMGNNKNFTSSVKTIAVCCGSGSSVLKDVKADVYLTGEMSHHDALHCAESGATVMLFEHSNTERGFLQHVKSNLEKEFSVEVVVSKTDRDPLVIY